jgi:hypothetical protein
VALQEAPYIGIYEVLRSEGFFERIGLYLVFSGTRHLQETEASRIMRAILPTSGNRRLEFGQRRSSKEALLASG